jgi:hypothetical protein
MMFFGQRPRAAQVLAGGLGNITLLMVRISS